MCKELEVMPSLPLVRGGGRVICPGPGISRGRISGSGDGCLPQAPCVVAG